MGTGVDDASPEHCSRADHGLARNPLNEAHCDESSLHAGNGMVDDQSRHLGHGPNDARGEARNPLRGERPGGDEPLCANVGAVGCEPRHQWEDPDNAGGVAPNPLGGGCKHCSSWPAQSEQQEVETPDETFSLSTLASPRRIASARRQQRRQMATARRKASALVQDVSVVDDNNEQLYTLVNGVTGEAEGNVSREAIPTVAALLELDEMSIPEFGDALKAGELAEVVMIRPEEELNSSSLMDEAVLEDTKEALSARSGASILKNPSDPLYPLVKEYQDVVSNDPPTGLPPDRGARHEIDLVPGTKYCVTRQWPLPKEQCDGIDAFFSAKHAAGMVRESKSPHSTPTFCVRKPNGKWRILHAFNKLNAATIPTQTPIPRKDVLQNNMVGCTMYSALDLVDGYY